MNLVYYLIILILSIIFNAMPAFAPSTWMVIAFFDLKFHLAYIPSLLIAILGSSIGRILLAKSTEVILHRVNNFQIRRNLAFFEKFTKNFRFGGPLIFSAIFFAFPTPSNWLFMAVGKNNKLLAQITIGHAIGRIINYTMAVMVARAAFSRVGDFLAGEVLSARGIALEIAGLAILVVSLFIDWESLMIEKKFRFNIKQKSTES